MSKPLDGLKVVEMAGMGPGPHAGMMLSDLGAQVVRIVRPNTPPVETTATSHTRRGRRTVVADLKQIRQLEAVRCLIGAADVIIEGFRPGVMERLGLGPDVCLADHPTLVYARMTGWGQSGPYATVAGHDINYISLTGVLHAIGPKEQPLPPLNLVGDFGGGSMFLMTGILAALVERERTGVGQVVDAAMVDGASVLAQSLLELRSEGRWTEDRHANLLDGGAPFYRTYRCADGGFMAVGAIEPQFYSLLLEGLELDPETLPDQNDQSQWSATSEVLELAFAEHPRHHWEGVFDSTDACVTPVLTFEEAPDHPHVAARGSLTRVDGWTTAGRAPRLSSSDSAAIQSHDVEELHDVVKDWT